LSENGQGKLKLSGNANDCKPLNNGARARLVIYWKGLEDQFAITNPSEIGGIKSEEYLKLNPQVGTSIT
jgi:hypothetical protein